jgi:hypothetical protein
VIGQHFGFHTIYERAERVCNFAQSILNGWVSLGLSARPHQRQAPGSIHIGSTGGSLWDEARWRLIDELTACFGRLPITPCASDSILWSVAGLATVADWDRLRRTLLLAGRKSE